MNIWFLISVCFRGGSIFFLPKGACIFFCKMGSMHFPKDFVLNGDIFLSTKSPVVNNEWSLIKQCPVNIVGGGGAKNYF